MEWSYYGIMELWYDSVVYTIGKAKRKKDEDDNRTDITHPLSR